MQSSSSEQPKHYNPADLRWPGGQQINHQTYLELLKMIYLAINYYVERKIQYLLTLKFDLFHTSLYRELFFLRRFI